MLIKKLVMDYYIICLEDGVKFKMFKCYLCIYYDMLLDEYWVCWGLLVDYLMVVLEYVWCCFDFVKKIGFGKKGC